MAKVRTPRDLLRVHADIARDVLWLETHSSGEPQESTKLVDHIHDIVEHLFRGSMQAHTGVAPFGHVAAHFWEMEHGPEMANNWEFHRKMRVLRERIGANRPLVDMVNLLLFGSNRNALGSGGAESPGYFVDNKGLHRTTSGYTRPAAAHLMVQTYGSIWQPYMVPGDPGRYETHYRITYFRPFDLGPPPQSEQGPFTSLDGPDEEFEARTAGVGQEATPGYSSADSAVNVGFFNESTAKGGAVTSRSRRWDRMNEEKKETLFPEFAYDGVTVPNKNLNGDRTGTFDADLDGTVPDDIFVWADRQFGEISLYPEGGEGDGGVISKSKRRVWVKKGDSDPAHCGVYGGMWYEATSSLAYTPRPDLGWVGRYAYVPADFIQSPGPPVDYGLVEGGTVEYNPESEEPPSGSAVQSLLGHHDIEDPLHPLRSFDEAVEIFEEIKDQPMFRELLRFWERHLTDFSRSGSPFNHGWTRVESIHPIETPEFTGGNPQGCKAEFLKRYGLCHLRGRLAFGNFTVFEEEEAWNCEGLPQPLLEEGSFGAAKGAFIEHICNSNIGPVRVQLRSQSSGTEEEATPMGLYFPDWGFEYGLGSTSNIAWIDLDGISYIHR